MPRDLNYKPGNNQHNCNHHCQCGGHCHEEGHQLAGIAIVHIGEGDINERLKERLAELRETIVSAYNEVTDICNQLGIDDDEED